MNTSRQSDTIEIALVNNMPDQALAATQMQFARLVRAAAGERQIKWRCYTLPGQERSETALRYLAKSHENIEALYGRGADALIVTGCEPRAARLDHEPYWPQLQTLVDWARTHTVSTLWSCLAAHAAALHLSGIERERLPKKLSGIYNFHAEKCEWMKTETASQPLCAPHSRYNDLPKDALLKKGYQISSISPDAGVNMFWREEPSLFVFLQGHPEYDADTLLREYRRDFLRALAGERNEPPEPPENYLSEKAFIELRGFKNEARAMTREQAETRLDEILRGEGREKFWSQDSARLFENWLSAVSARLGALRHSA